MLRLGPPELIIILVIIIAIFGAGKLADVGGALGRGIKDFRSAVGEEADEADDQELSKPAAKKRKAEAAPSDGPLRDSQ